MTKTPPQHGERRCYLRGCRRPECRTAHYRYMSRYRLDRARGNQRRVPTGPAAAHVKTLHAAGWSSSQIAAVAGCSERVVICLAAGTYATMRADLAARITAAQPHYTSAKSTTYVNATGSIRRVRALIAIGHPLTAIAQAVGITKTALGRIINYDHERITARNAQAIAALYSKWAAAPGNNVRSRNRAATLGWHGPMAWDADTIDDPNAEPETFAPYQPIAKGGRDSMRRAEIAHLLSCGESIATIARRMDRDTKYIGDLISQGLDTPTYEAAA